MSGEKNSIVKMIWRLPVFVVVLCVVTELGGIKTKADSTKLTNLTIRDDTSVSISDPNSKKKHKVFTADEFSLDMVAAYGKTIKDDLNIRITQAGLDYLAKTLKLNLIGLVRATNTDPNAWKQTIPAVLNDAVIGQTANVVDLLDCNTCLQLVARYPNATFGLSGVGSKCTCTGTGAGFGENRTLHNCDNCQADNASGDNDHFFRGGWFIEVFNPFDPNPRLAPSRVKFNYAPFFKEALEYYKWDPNRSGQLNAAYDDVLSGNDCLVDATGSYPTGSLCDPKSPKIGLFPSASGQLNVKIVLYDIALHGDIYVAQSPGSVDLCPCPNATLSDDPNYQGLATLMGGQLGIQMAAKFTDGYQAMLNDNGDAPTGGNPPSWTPSCGPPAGGGTGTPPPNISNQSLLDIGAAVNPGGGSQGGECFSYLNESRGYCTKNNIDVRVSGPGFCATVIGGLTGMLSGLLQGMLRDAVVGVLDTQIGNLLRTTVGLPIDFNQLFAGGPSTRGSICSIRSTLLPTIGGCNHSSSNCSCDDKDGDGLLNYQDTDDSLFLTGIDPDTGQAWDETMYGVGTGLGGWTNEDGTVYDAPSYDIGAYLTVNYDSNGIGLLADLAMIPQSQANVWANSCFNGKVYKDITGPDIDPSNRVNAATPPFSSWDSVVMTGGGVKKQHIIIGVSQYDLEEVFNAFVTSGMLCFVIDKDFLGLGDMMRISNFKSIVPALDKPAVKADYYPSDYIQVVMRPTGVPTVRVLGGRNIVGVNAAGWPAGDCIPNDGANIHTNTNMEILQAVVPCPVPPSVPAPRGHTSVYDLMAAFPQFKLDFYAPFRGNLNDKRILFSLNIDFVLTMAMEATQNGSITVSGNPEPKFLELLVEPWLGCSGTILDTAGTGLPTNCLTPVNLNAAILTKGLSSLLVTLLNARFGLLLRTTFNISGLGMDFGLIGMFPETYNPAYDNDTAANTSKKYSKYGYGSNDFLGVSAVFAGALDFGKIFSLIGGSLAPAPYMLEPETYIIPDGPLVSLGSQDHMPGTWYDLTPAESASFGFTPEGTRFKLVSAPAVSKLDQNVYDIRYSYRYDYGMWSPFKPIEDIQFDYLMDGHHILEVRAGDSDRYVDSTPARIAFWIDSQPPDLSINIEGKLHRSSADVIKMTQDDTMVLDISDNVSKSENLRSSWRLNGGRWHPYVADARLALPLDAGRRNILSVRSTDEFGNNASQNFYLETVTTDRGFGCAVSSGGSRFEFAFLMVAIGLGMALLRREEQA